MAISGLSRVRTELFQLLVIPFLTHHPEQANGEPTGHGHLRIGLLVASVQKALILVVPLEVIGAKSPYRSLTSEKAKQKRKLVQTPDYDT